MKGTTVETHDQPGITLTARNARLENIFDLLKTQRAVMRDAIVPGQAITSTGGTLHVAGMGPAGPVGDPGRFQPTEIADAHLADKLGIPVKYLRRMRDTRPDLYDANVNGWLQGHDPSEVGPDARSFMVRAFTDQDDPFGVGVARAVLSDHFKRVDNLDVMVSLFEAVKEAGLTVTPTRCDLSERRMVLRLEAPEIRAAAPALLRGYRSPFTGAEGGANPVVSAGVIITNSETGGSAFTVGPYLTILICKNGMTRTEMNQRIVHLGGKLDEGVLEWSDETQRLNLDLIRSRTRDSLRWFLSEDFLFGLLEEAEALAGHRLENPGEAVRQLSTNLSWTQGQLDGIMDMFIKGGQSTAGGVMQAVTAYAQTVTDPDECYDLEASAWKVLEGAAKLN